MYACVYVVLRMRACMLCVCVCVEEESLFNLHMNVIQVNQRVLVRACVSVRVRVCAHACAHGRASLCS